MSKAGIRKDARGLRQERININDQHLSARMEGLATDPSYICYPKLKLELSFHPQRHVAIPAHCSFVFKIALIKFEAFLNVGVDSTRAHPRGGPRQCDRDM